MAKKNQLLTPSTSRKTAVPLLKGQMGKTAKKLSEKPGAHRLLAAVCSVSTVPNGKSLKKEPQVKLPVCNRACAKK